MSTPTHEPRPRPTWLRAVPFLLVFAVATWLHFLMQSEVASHVTRDVNAAIAAALINTASPTAHVAVSGTAQLGNAEATVSIATGCDGIDAMLMLVAAVAVFPMPWRKRVLGVLLGASFLFAVNVLRIIALWYCLRYWPSFFDTMHLTVGQTVVIVCAVAFFAVWTGVLANPHSTSPTLRTEG